MIGGLKEMDKLYALINKNLTPSQKAVQAGHAVSKFASKHPEIDWNEQYFVYLDATEFQMQKHISDMQIKNINHETFFEPDLDNLLTSVVSIGDGKQFKRFNLI